jgi:beta-glucosidase
MVIRIVASWYRLGQDQVCIEYFAMVLFISYKDYPPPNFDTQHPDGSGPLNGNVNVRTSETLSLVREIASASTVLLKNSNHALPLKAKNIHSMAVIGLDAQTPDPDCSLDECDTGVVTVG